MNAVIIRAGKLRVVIVDGDIEITRVFGSELIRGLQTYGEDNTGLITLSLPFYVVLHDRGCVSRARIYTADSYRY